MSARRGTLARRLRRAALTPAVLLPALAPATAAAHAQLLRTDPVQGARLAAAPAQVDLRFSEAVTASRGAVRVFDGAGRTVQAGDAFHPGGRGDAIAVRLPRRLADGGYTAVYRVVSADSHPVSGGVSFQVGTGGAAAPGARALVAGATTGPVTATALGVARGVQYSAIALALGALLLTWLCWRPGLRAVGDDDRGSAAAAAFGAGRSRLWVVAGVAGAGSAMAGIVLEGAVGAGTSAWAALDAGAVGNVLGTRFGRTWALGLLAWLVVLAAGRRRGRDALVAVPLAGLCLLPAFGGHAATAEPVAVMLPANVLHVVAIGVWAGGVATLALLLPHAAAALEPADRPALLRAVMTRFSTVAGIAVAVVLATGVAQSLVGLSAWGQLLHTAYGRAVLVKLALFAVLLGFGALQRRRVLPRLGHGAPLRRALAGELAVMVLVLGVTGALATYPPGDAQAAAEPAGPVTRTVTIGPARARITLAPASTGANDVVVTFTDRRTGQPWRLPEEVTVSAALPSAGIHDLTVELHGNGEGRFAASGFSLPAAGDWRLDLAARVSDFDQDDATFRVPIR